MRITITFDKLEDLIKFFVALSLATFVEVKQEEPQGEEAQEKEAQEKETQEKETQEEAPIWNATEPIWEA
jgi:hypothetical protein